MAKGEGVGVVKIGKATSFMIATQGATAKDIEIRITGKY